MYAAVKVHLTPDSSTLLVLFIRKFSSGCLAHSQIFISSFIVNCVTDVDLSPLHKAIRTRVMKNMVRLMGDKSMRDLSANTMYVRNALQTE